jgi:hypothetical protein
MELNILLVDRFKGSFYSTFTDYVHFNECIDLDLKLNKDTSFI